MRRRCALGPTLAALFAALLVGEASAGSMSRAGLVHGAVCAAVGSRLTGDGDVGERALAGGGRALVVSDRTVAAGIARLGFPALATATELAALAEPLEAAARAALGPGAAVTLEVERDDASLVFALSGPRANLGKAAARVVRALAAPLATSPIQATTKADSPVARRDYVDLTGARRPFGPDPDGDGAAATALASIEPTTHADGEAAPPRTLADLQAAIIRREGLVLALVSDLELDAAAALGEELAAVLPSRSGAATRSWSLAVPLTREVLVRAEPGLTLGGFAVFGAGCRADAPDAAALLVLEESLTEALNQTVPDAGFCHAPGWGCSGRISAWCTAPPAVLHERAAALLATLAGAGGVTREAFERARANALLRIEGSATAPPAGAAPASALKSAVEAATEQLVREQRLALRGAPTGWLASLATEVARIEPAALEFAAQRYFDGGELIAAAYTATEHVQALEALGAIVEYSPADEGDGHANGRAQVEAERRAADAAVQQLFDVLGGRSRFASARAAELVFEASLEGAQALRCTQVLDLELPRFVLRVDDGGRTVLGDDAAQWSGAGVTRALDRDALAHEARLGLFTVLHRLAIEQIEGRLTDAGLVLEEAGEPLCVLTFDEEGRPLTLTDTGPRALRWRFADWSRAEGRVVPLTITDEARGPRVSLESVRFFERFDAKLVK
ncbi:MAG: hypothetical protein R3F49_03590 [Planctomycetota bacterium]